MLSDLNENFLNKLNTLFANNGRKTDNYLDQLKHVCTAANDLPVVKISKGSISRIFFDILLKSVDHEDANVRIFSEEQYDKFIKKVVVAGRPDVALKLVFGHLQSVQTARSIVVLLNRLDQLLFRVSKWSTPSSLVFTLLRQLLSMTENIVIVAVEQIAPRIVPHLNIDIFDMKIFVTDCITLGTDATGARARSISAVAAACCKQSFPLLFETLQTCIETVVSTILENKHPPIAILQLIKLILPAVVICPNITKSDYDAVSKVCVITLLLLKHESNEVVFTAFSLLEEITRSATSIIFNFHPDVAIVAEFVDAKRKENEVMDVELSADVIIDPLINANLYNDKNSAVKLDLTIPCVDTKGKNELPRFLLSYIFQEFLMKTGIRSSLLLSSLQCVRNLLQYTKKISNIVEFAVGSKELTKMQSLAICDDDGVACKAINVLTNIEYLSGPNQDNGFFETYLNILYTPNAVMRQKCLIENFSDDRFYAIFHKPVFDYLLSFSLEKVDNPNFKISCGLFLASIDWSVFYDNEKLHKRPIVRRKLLNVIASTPNLENVVERFIKTTRTERESYVKMFTLPLVSNMEKAFHFTEIAYGQYRRILDEFLYDIAEVEKSFMGDQCDFSTFNSVMFKMLPATLYSYNALALKQVLNVVTETPDTKIRDVTNIYSSLTYFMAGKAVKLIHSDAYDEVKLSAKEVIVASLRVFNLYYSLLSLDTQKEKEGSKFLRLLGTTPKRQGDAAKDPAETTHFDTSKGLKSIYEDMRGSYTNFLQSLDPLVDSKFISLYEAAATAFCAALEVLKFPDFTFYEETLVYLKTLITIAPRSSFRVVQQLLKCLLSRNMAHIDREQFNNTITMFGSTPGEAYRTIFDVFEDLEKPEKTLLLQMGWLRPELIRTPELRNNNTVTINLPKLDETMTYMIKLYRYQSDEEKSQTLSLMGELLRAGILYEMVDPKSVIQTEITKIIESLESDSLLNFSTISLSMEILPELVLYIISCSRSGSYDVKNLPFLALKILRTVQQLTREIVLDDTFYDNGMIAVRHLILECKRISLPMENVAQQFSEMMDLKRLHTTTEFYYTAILLQQSHPESEINCEIARKMVQIYESTPSSCNLEILLLFLSSVARREVFDNDFKKEVLTHDMCLMIRTNKVHTSRIFDNLLDMIRNCNVTTQSWNDIDILFSYIRRYRNEEWQKYSHEAKLDPRLHDYVSRRLNKNHFKLQGILKNTAAEETGKTRIKSGSANHEQEIDWLKCDRIFAIFTTLNSGSAPVECYKFITGLDVPDIQRIIENLSVQYQKAVITNIFSNFYVRLGELEILSTQLYAEMKLRIEELMGVCLESASIGVREKISIVAQYQKFLDGFGLTFDLEESQMSQFLEWVADQEFVLFLPEELRGLKSLLRHTSTTKMFLEKPWSNFTDLVNILKNIKHIFEKDYAIFPLHRRIGDSLIVKVPTTVPENMDVVLKSYDSVQTAIVEAFILVRSAFIWKKSTNLHGCEEILEVVQHILRHRIFYELACVSIEAMEFSWTPIVDVREDGNVIVSLPQIHLLAQPEVFEHFETRLTWLGWITRRQFEDTWMNLFGVLSSTPTGQETTDVPEEEIKERMESSIRALKFLTQLLLRSLTYPTVGDPSNFFIVKTSVIENAFLDTIEARKASILKSRLAGGHPRSSYVHNFFNPEETSERHFLGLLSVPWLWKFTKKSNERVTKQCIKPSASTFVISTACDLDISSSIRALLDIIGHWLQRGLGETSSLLLDTVITSIVSLSDLFDDEEQYQFMFRELTKIKLTEVPSCFVFGIFKAVAVVGFDQIAPYWSNNEKMKYLEKLADSIMYSRHFAKQSVFSSAMSFAMQNMNPISTVHVWVLNGIKAKRDVSSTTIQYFENLVMCSSFEYLVALAVVFFQIPQDAKSRKINSAVFEELKSMWLQPYASKRITNFLTDVIERIVIYSPESASTLLLSLINILAQRPVTFHDPRGLFRIFSLCVARTSPLPENTKQNVLSCTERLISLMKDVKIGEMIVTCAPDVFHYLLTPKKVVSLLMKKYREPKVTRLLANFMTYLEEYDASQVTQCRHMIRDFVSKQMTANEFTKDLLRLSVAAVRIPDMQFLSVGCEVGFKEVKSADIDYVLKM